MPESYGDRFIPRRYALQPELMNTSFNLSEPESDNMDIFEMVNNLMKHEKHHQVATNTIPTYKTLYIMFCLFVLFFLTILERNRRLLASP